jgi:UDP:flavonoid glycosyltransferase YjiC (YdhE family)
MAALVKILVACTPVHGHLGPLLRATRELVRRSNEVVVLTGSRFGAAVGATGARHVPLPAGADYDDRDLDASFPGRASKRGPAKLNFDVVHLFADPVPHQYRALEELRREFSPDAVLADTAFGGAAVWALSDIADRPPVVVANVTFLTLSGRGVPPAGVGLTPMPGLIGRARDALVLSLAEKVILRSGLARFNHVFETTAGRRLPGSFFDGPLLADRLLVLTVPSFEYPRVDLPERVSFVGPMLPLPSEIFDPPGWWSDLDAGVPVIHVTQGTIDTSDLGRLIAPTLAALASEDILVVVTTGGRPPSAVPGKLPANARIEAFIPYDRLLPNVDVMVTNGGYGGVQYALSHGLPLVVAGEGEDKPDIAARVAWSGAGINLRTGRPSAAKVLAAVRRTLTEPSFRERARAIQAEMASYDAVTTVADTLEQLAGRRSSSG